MPREWPGIVAAGEVEIVRGLHGRQTQLATLIDSALISEGILIDECAHLASAFARGSSTRVIQVPRAVRLLLQNGWLTKDKLDDLLSPANMTDPRQLST